MLSAANYKSTCFVWTGTSKWTFITWIQIFCVCRWIPVWWAMVVEHIPRSRTISLTMYLSIPLLCSGWRKDRNSISFSSWSFGLVSAWYQRSFRLSNTSWAASTKPTSLPRQRTGNFGKLQKHIFSTHFPRPVSDPRYFLFSRRPLFHWSLCWPKTWPCIHPTSRDLRKKRDTRDSGSTKVALCTFGSDGRPWCVKQFSVSLTVAIGVHCPEAVLVLHHGLLEVLLRLLHDPALHLFGADTPVLVEIHSEDLGTNKEFLS